MASDSLYSAAIDFVGFVGGSKLLGEETNQVLFEGKPVDAHWGDSDNGREVEGVEFRFDKKYWELMGKPEKIFLGMGTEAGFGKWVGPKPDVKVGKWLEATT